MAAALSMPSLCRVLDVPGWLALLIVLICLPVGILLWRRLTPAGPPNPWKDVLFLLILVPIPLVLSLTLVAFPLFGNGLALVFLGWALLEIWASDAKFPYSSENVSADDAQAYRQDQRMAWIAVGLAIALNLVAWL